LLCLGVEEGDEVGVGGGVEGLVGDVGEGGGADLVAEFIESGEVVGGLGDTDGEPDGERLDV
jgi:hypothetical protein